MLLLQLPVLLLLAKSWVSLKSTHLGNLVVGQQPSVKLYSAG
jgi:hypothetical protein